MAGRTDDTPAPSAVEHELDGSRERLADLLDELDRRRHEILDMPAQLRKHMVPFAIGAGVLVAGVTAAITIAVHRKRERRRLTVKAHRLREAFGRMARHPDRVARERPSAFIKVITAAATTALSIVARRVVRATMERAAYARKNRQLVASSNGSGHPSLSAPRW